MIRLAVLFSLISTAVCAQNYILPIVPKLRPNWIEIAAEPSNTSASFNKRSLPIVPRLRPFSLGQRKVTPIRSETIFSSNKVTSSSKVKVRGKSVCGSRDIIGAPVPAISRGACGISNPVRITAVSGVRLSSPATVNCTTAKALNKWVDKSAKPTLKRNGKLVELKVVASYSCRTRNSRKGAKLSEHAKGNAVDIAGFKLANGQTLTVLKDWRGRNSKALKKMHKGACGTFGTVLGPNSDRFHQDHFHFDVARYRSGAYCR